MLDWHTSQICNPLEIKLLLLLLLLLLEISHKNVVNCRHLYDRTSLFVFHFRCSISKGYLLIYLEITTAIG